MTFSVATLVAASTSAICTIVAIVESTAAATAAGRIARLAAAREPIAPMVAVLETKPEASPAIGSPALAPSRRTAR